MIKRPERKAKYPPALSAEVKNGWSYISIRPIYLQRVEGENRNFLSPLLRSTSKYPFSSLQVFPSPTSECIPHLTDAPTIFFHMPQWNVKKILPLINSYNVTITVEPCRPFIQPSGSDLVTDKYKKY